MEHAVGQGWIAVPSAAHPAAVQRSGVLQEHAVVQGRITVMAAIHPATTCSEVFLEHAVGQGCIVVSSCTASRRHWKTGSPGTRSCSRSGC